MWQKQGICAAEHDDVTIVDGRWSESYALLGMTPFQRKTFSLGT